MSLSDISDGQGHFSVLAIDHRDSLRVFLSPEDPGSITPDDITKLKIDIVRAMAPSATGVMLEPEYSIPQVSNAGVLPKGIGFIAALEAQGYLTDSGVEPARLLDGWSVEGAAASGAACVKLLLQYHPDHSLAAAQEAFALDVVAKCRRVGIPIVLEPLFYGLDNPADRTRVVITTAARFTALNPDLLKLPFPVDTVHDPDEDHWFASCRAISELAHMPWVLLSGGGLFTDFVARLRVASSAGCRGFMAGRVLWGDAARATRDHRGAALAEAAQRMGLLRSVMS